MEEATGGWRRCLSAPASSQEGRRDAEGNVAAEGRKQGDGGTCGQEEAGNEASTTHVHGRKEGGLVRSMSQPMEWRRNEQAGTSGEERQAADTRRKDGHDGPGAIDGKANGCKNANATPMATEAPRTWSSEPWWTQPSSNEAWEPRREKPGEENGSGRNSPEDGMGNEGDAQRNDLNRQESRFRFIKSELKVLMERFEAAQGVTPTVQECANLAKEFNQARRDQDVFGHVRAVSIKWWFENKRRMLRMKRKAMKREEEEAMRRGQTNLPSKHNPRIMGARDFSAWNPTQQDAISTPAQVVTQANVFPSAPLRRGLALEFSLAPPNSGSVAQVLGFHGIDSGCSFAREIAMYWNSTKGAVDRMHLAHVTHSGGKLTSSLAEFGKALKDHRDRMVKLVRAPALGCKVEEGRSWCVSSSGLPSLNAGLRYFTRYVQEIHRWIVMVETKLITELSGRQRASLAELDAQAASSARSHHASLVATLQQTGGDREQIEQEFRSTLVAVEELRYEVLMKLLHVDPNTVSLLTAEQSASLLLLICWPKRGTEVCCPMCSATWDVDCVI
uniref:Homeobox domain-containing protein n=1 Tax=Picocystis salinarum TaxID=88271 RepID=A0A6U9R7G5_9CHLO|mmetsp:Transcript_11268/g.69602  ORF Transcript_11268/g.69602 Transcript_11268/m.69602 type:complete len:559 (-) Transcript_11268:4377-6053(-)